MNKLIRYYSKIVFNFFRIPTSGLPEIRHKTAVSTIRSTAEKAATKDKSQKIKTTEPKKKNLHTQDSPGKLID